MTKKEYLQLFEEKKVRTVWDDKEEKCYFSIVDVCYGLPQKHMMKRPKNYKWNASKITNRLQQKLKIKRIKNLKYVW